MVNLLPGEGEAQNGKVNMQTATSNNLIFKDISSFKRHSEHLNQAGYGGLYQQIALSLIKGFQTKQDFIEHAARLVILAEHNHAHRRLDVLEQVSQALMNLPVGGSFKQVGQYYFASCIMRQGKLDEAQARFEALASDATNHYRSLAIMSLAAMAYKKGDNRSALPLYIEAGRAAASKGSADLSTQLVVQRSVAAIKSVEGDHTGALADLTSSFSLARAFGRWQPYLFYQHLNSLAVELGEVGRLEEAKRASEITLASAYAHAYPEWRETRNDLEEKSRRPKRSFVAGVESPVEASNVTYLPFAGHTGNFASPQSPNAPFRQARIIRFEEWNKMSKELNTSQAKFARPQIQQMTVSEKQAALLKLIYADNVSEELLDKLLKTVEDMAVGKQAHS